ncbi:MAG: hypothetical protein WB764_01235 [Xanthobacteraceae bacterium]
MKLVFKRGHEEKVKIIQEAGLLRKRIETKEIEYRLTCRLVLSDTEDAILTKYVGSDYPMTYQGGYIGQEGGIFGYGVSYVFKATSPTEYSTEKDARQAGNGPTGVGLYLSNLRKGVTYIEHGGVGILLRQERILKEACQSLQNLMTNRSSYSGEEETSFE